MITMMMFKIDDNDADGDDVEDYVNEGYDDEDDDNDDDDDDDNDDDDDDEDLSPPYLSPPSIQGMAAPPNTSDNCVHASASPLEGLAERMNWWWYYDDSDDFYHYNDDDDDDDDDEQQYMLVEPSIVLPSSLQHCTPFLCYHRIPSSGWRLIQTQIRSVP